MDVDLSKFTIANVRLLDLDSIHMIVQDVSNMDVGLYVLIISFSGNQSLPSSLLEPPLLILTVLDINTLPPSKAQ